MATTEAHPLTGARALGDEHGDAVPPLEGGDVGVDLGGKLGKLGDAKPGQESANFYGGDKAWGGRHVKYDELTPLANLHLALLDDVGVHLDRFVDSTGHAVEVMEPLSL